MNKIFFKIYNNQEGAAGIFMAMLILTALLSVSLIMSEIIRNNMQMNKNRFHSTKAFFAAEAGAEQILWKIRQDSSFDLHNSPNTCPATDGGTGIICFNNSLEVVNCFANSSSCISPNTTNLTLSNGAKYNIDYDYEIIGASATTTMTAIGNFLDLNRVVEVKY